jgi:hypothetical protein
MKWFAHFKFPIFLALLGSCYCIYLWDGCHSAEKDWQDLVHSFSLSDREVSKAAVRKDVVKHLFYSTESERFSFDIQAVRSSLSIHPENQGMLLEEELESVIGSFWDRSSNKAYTLFLPNAYFDYPKKLLKGYQAQLEEFDSSTKAFLGKGTSDEIECHLTQDPTLKLKRIHATLE